MSPAQAAVIIGCSPQQVRWLIRKGTIKAKRRKSLSKVKGAPVWEYVITEAQAVQAKDHKKDGRGYPRGRPRK